MPLDRYKMRFSLARCQLALLLACVGGATLAQTPSPSRYPWDARPATCLNESRAAAPECALDNWPTFDETVQRVAFLYQTEQFPLLERALADIVSSNKRYVSGNPASSAAYWAFRRLMPGPGVPSGTKDRVARWRAAIPQSYFVVFAEARYQYGNAWNARGSGYAGSVSKESWELFSTRLREAEQVLLKAPQQLRDTPLWHNLLLAISLDTDAVQSDPQDVFERAVKAWPAYYDFYNIVLTRLVPRWGGSWEKVDTFIDYWTKQQASREGASLYARLYINLRSQGITPDQTRLSWEKMKRSFVDLIARYPDPVFKNLYASYACFARDKAAFVEAMRGLPSNLLLRDYWLSGHSHEACLRWAGI
jgi:hypothetical protein